MALPDAEEDRQENSNTSSPDTSNHNNSQEMDKILVRDILDSVDVSVRLENIVRNSDFPFVTVKDYLISTNPVMQLLKLQNAGKKTANEFQTIIEGFLEEPNILNNKVEENDEFLNGNKPIDVKNIKYLYAQYLFPKTLLEFTTSVRLQNVLKKIEKDPDLEFNNLSDCAFRYKNFIQFIRKQKNVGKTSIEELSELLKNTLTQILAEMSVDHDIAIQYNSILIDGSNLNGQACIRELVSTINEQIESSLTNSNQSLSDYRPKGFSFKYTGRDALFTEMKNLLDQRSLDVLCRRFGLENYSQHTLQEVADIYEVTRERIRQLEHAAVKVKLKTLKRAFFTCLDEDFNEITEKLFENEGCFPKDSAYFLFKSIGGFTLLSINICYDDIYDYLENNHLLINNYWVDNSLSEENKYALKQEILGFGSIGEKTKTLLKDVLTSVPWPISLIQFQEACTDLSESEIVNGLEKHFEVQFERNAVVATNKGLRSSEKITIVLRKAGSSLPVHQVASLYSEMFCQEVNDGTVSNMLGSHPEALIVKRGEYDIYENLTLDEHDLSEIRRLSFEYIKDKNTFVSAGALFRDLFEELHEYGDNFNNYMLYGILQDDLRFIYKRGLMLGLSSFSSDLFTSLTDRISEIVQDFGQPIHLRDVQEKLSVERDVLDVTVIMMLEANDQIEKVGPSTFKWKY